MSIAKRGGLSARMILATLGGLAQLVAGVNNHYYADHSTAKKRVRIGTRHGKGKRSLQPAGSKPMGRGKGWTGQVGAGYMSHFDSKGINWSSKPSRARV